MACFTLSTTSLSDDGSVASIVATKMASRRWNGNLPRRQPLCSKRRPKISWLASLPTNSKPKKKHRELKGRVHLRYARKSDCFVAKDLDGELQYDESETKCLRTLFKWTTTDHTVLRFTEGNQRHPKNNAACCSKSRSFAYRIEVRLMINDINMISMETSAKETFSISVLWNEWFSNFRQQTQQFVESWVNVLQGESKMYQVEPTGWYP